MRQLRSRSWTVRDCRQKRASPNDSCALFSPLWAWSGAALATSSAFSSLGLTKCVTVENDAPFFATVAQSKSARAQLSLKTSLPNRQLLTFSPPLGRTGLSDAQLSPSEGAFWRQLLKRSQRARNCRRKLGCLSDSYAFSGARAGQRAQNAQLSENWPSQSGTPFCRSPKSNFR